MTVLELLPETGDITQWTPQQAALLEGMGLKGTRNRQVNGEWRKVPFEAPRPVVEMFLAECRRTGLDPIAKEIYCIERGGKWSIEVGINGIRGKAEETGDYAGQLPHQWTADGVTWLDVWIADEPPKAARARVLRRGWDEPAYGVVTYAGYAPRNKKGEIEPTGRWAYDPAGQLAKCAEMAAFRKAFPRRFTGLHVSEEMENVTADVVTDPVQEYLKEIRAIDDKQVLRDFHKQLKDSQELTGDLHSAIVQHASTLTKDSGQPNPEVVNDDGDADKQPADADQAEPAPSEVGPGDQGV